MRSVVRLAIPPVLAAVAVAGGATARGQERADRHRDAQDRRADDDRAAQQAVARELTGLVPGRASSCLPPAITRSAGSRIYGSTIIYRVSSGLKYRSDTNVPCGSRNSGPDTDILVTQTPIGRNCSGDPVRVVDRYTGVLRGVCSFGPFVPYRRP